MRSELTLLSAKWAAMSQEERDQVARDELGIEPRVSRLPRRACALVIGTLSLALWCAICVLAWWIF